MGGDEITLTFVNNAWKKYKYTDEGYRSIHIHLLLLKTIRASVLFYARDSALGDCLFILHKIKIL